MAEASAFPILDKRPTNKSGRYRPPETWGKIRNLARRERSMIERLQPYKGWLLGEIRPLVHQHRQALADISKINNIDKHRSIHLCYTAVHSLLGFDFASEYGWRNHPAFNVPLESNTCIDQWTFAKEPPSHVVSQYRGIYTGVALTMGGPPILAVSHLGGCILAVDHVITQIGRPRFSTFRRPKGIGRVRMTREPMQ